MFVISAFIDEVGKWLDLM